MLKSMQEILEYGFEILNKVYFNGELPPVVISIMSSPRTNGHFTINKEWRVEDKRFNEINFLEIIFFLHNNHLFITIFLKNFQLCGWNMRRGGILRDEKTA